MYQPRVLFALGLALVIAAASGCSSHMTLRLSEADLQKRLDKKFPIEKSKSVVKVLLGEPTLKLRKGSHQLETTVKANVFALGAPLGASSATITGGIRYDNKSKAFYMTEPTVTDLDVSHVPERYQSKLRQLVDMAANELLPQIPIYRLDKKTFKHKTARTFLKRAWVEDEHLHLEMGI